MNLTSIDDYKLDKMLGQGAFAMVREAYHLETGYRVAIKIYDKYKLNKNLQTKYAGAKSDMKKDIMSRTRRAQWEPCLGGKGSLPLETAPAAKKKQKSRSL